MKKVSYLVYLGWKGTFGLEFMGLWQCLFEVLVDGLYGWDLSKGATEYVQNNIHEWY